MKKVALITGASSGIGAELARIHATQGGDLILIARRLDKLETLKAELEDEHGATVHVLSKDLTHPEAAQEVYDHIKSEGWTVDFLINNAGFGGVGKFHERKMATDMAMIQLNVTVLTALTRLFLPDMVARQHGRILNVSSTASLMPGPMQAVYFATKAFVTSFSNAIARELEGTGVTVTALLPGATATEFGQRSGMDKTPMFDRTFTAQEVAQAGYQAMLKGQLNIITGVTFAQRLLMRIAPLVPRKFLLDQIMAMQSARK